MNENANQSQEVIRLIGEHQASVRAHRIHLLTTAFKIVIASIIGLGWDLYYSTYSESIEFEEDLRTFFAQHFSDYASDIVAEVIAWLTPGFCWCCLLYPVHCYLKAIGWYRQSSSGKK